MFLPKAGSHGSLPAADPFIRSRNPSQEPIHAQILEFIKKSKFQEDCLVFLQRRGTR